LHGKQIERLVSGSYTPPKGPNFGPEAGKRLWVWVAPWPVQRIDTPDPKRAEGTNPKPILKSHPDKGMVMIDADTQITGIPCEAWDYRLGNRSAIDWVLDQHKEKTPRDPTIREKFNTYRFADYKESIITLLAKVVRVSVETVAITKAMAGVERG